MEQPEKPEGRLSNGQFASKSRPVGRKKGTPNKATRAVKEFLAALADDGDVQAAVRERILAGDAVAFFRAVDHVLGKPKENIDLDVTIRGLDDRIRAAAARALGKSS